MAATSPVGAEASAYETAVIFRTLRPTCQRRQSRRALVADYDDFAATRIAAAQGPNCWKRLSICAICRAASAAVAGRRAGFFCSSGSTKSESSSGTSLFDCHTGRCGSRQMRCSTASAPCGSKRRVAGRHEVQHGAQAEQIGAMVDRCAGGLLGRHVVRRAGEDARVRQTRVVDRAGQAEVGEHGAFDGFFEQDVRGFHVAMDETLRVGGREPDAACMPIRRISSTPSGPSSSTRACSERPGTYCITRNGTLPSASTL